MVLLPAPPWCSLFAHVLEPPSSLHTWAFWLLSWSWFPAKCKKLHIFSLVAWAFLRWWVSPLREWANFLKWWAILLRWWANFSRVLGFIFSLFYAYPHIWAQEMGLSFGLPRNPKLPFLGSSMGLMKACYHPYHNPLKQAPGICVAWAHLSL